MLTGTKIYVQEEAHARDAVSLQHINGEEGGEPRPALALLIGERHGGGYLTPGEARRMRDVLTGWLSVYG